MMARIFTQAAIGLGSNLDDPAAQVRGALSELRNLPHTGTTACSPLYRSRALRAPGEAESQPDYCNAVAIVETALEPLELLEQLLAIETAHGRARKQKWTSRTLDLDLLVYGDLRMNDEQLSIPHPQMHLRNFVLYPLRDVAADMIVPGLGRVGELAARLTDEGLEKWPA